MSQIELWPINVVVVVVVVVAGLLLFQNLKTIYCDIIKMTNFLLFS